MTDDARIRLLDELAANATIAGPVRMLDGWVLRYAPAVPFRRSNCALATGGPSALTTKELGARCDELEAFYDHFGAPARVQVTPIGRPTGLDPALAARGYRTEAPVDVLVADVRVVLTNAEAVGRLDEPEPRAEVADALPTPWLADFSRAADPIAATRAEAWARLVHDLPLESVTAAAHRGDAVAGLGLGVFERGWLGVFGMATAPAHRRHGVASAVVRALAGAAAARGIRRAYLQVEQDNAGARALYEVLGFRHAYSYHYRLRTD
ncbi:MAG TPA: GNAT family N-acetyltransferase [Acidimicrobiia bacterium]|nr:GNAT family N-acetyltransferase [Acidimicrobiia bacterium]